VRPFATVAKNTAGSTLAPFFFLTTLRFASSPLRSTNGGAQKSGRGVSQYVNSDVIDGRSDKTTDPPCKVRFGARIPDSMRRAKG
jgi:hypothetical protein